MGLATYITQECLIQQSNRYTSPNSVHESLGGGHLHKTECLIAFCCSAKHVEQQLQVCLNKATLLLPAVELS